MSKHALVTGITGQDGSYLAELLLDKGYTVFGLVPRYATNPYENIAHLLDDVTIIPGDLGDSSSLYRAVAQAAPDEVYNLGAQSFVKGSWDLPELTGDVTGVGVTRLLEVIRNLRPQARFYQASSSEMYGKVVETPQTESTAFYPRSPYGVAKVYGHWITVNYRESYDLYACSGILFNHECVTGDTPVIIRQDGMVDCLPIAEVVRDPAHMPQRELDLEIWDKDGWTRATLGTATWNTAGRKSDKQVHRTLARCGSVQTTAEHLLINEEGVDVATKDVETSDRLLTTSLLEPLGVTEVSTSLAYFLGMMVADGSVWLKEGRFSAAFRNNSSAVLKQVADLWLKLFGGVVADGSGRSGFTGAPTGGLRLHGPNGVRQWLYDTMYTRDGAKRVPRLVLNADADAWRAFLSGYNRGDGLKAGNGKREFKNFKTSSPTLAAGLWWMASQVLNQKLTLNIDTVERKGVPYHYYSINLGTEGGSAKGRHLLRPDNQVKRVWQEEYSGWLYDIETESGTFHAGVGNLVIHNSPRRGREFVTRKIARGAARIKQGLDTELRLGNLDAKRDWGFAGDYVEMMWLMLQQDTPDDYVIGTGENHTVQEFCELAFGRVDLNWKDYVVEDDEFKRPAEVDTLLSDPSKAKDKLGWKPKVSFQQLVEMMVDAEVDAHKKGTAV